MAPPGTRSPVRVAVVTPSYPPAVGGLERYTQQIALALRDHPDFEVVVITAGTAKRTRTAVEDGITVVRLASWVTVSHTRMSGWWPIQLPRLFRSHRIDVINAHAPTPYLADVATYVAGRRPVVLTYHAGSMVKGGDGVTRAVDALLRTYERVVLPRVFARADRLVAVSPTCTGYLEGRTALVPPGVDTSQFVPPADDPAGTLTVLYAGRMQRASRWKGVQVLLEAFAQVLADLPAARLVLAGDGDDVPALRARASELGVDGSVSFAGALAGADLVRAYQDADVVVLPSLTEAESFGMTLVEAMACGRPVVASRVGGIPGVVRDGVDGLLVPPGDVVALAGGLRRLLADPVLRATLGTAGRQAAVSRWDWRHPTAATLRILRDVAPRRQ